MEDIEKIYDKLDLLIKLFGFTGTIILIGLILGGYLTWRFITKFVEDQSNIIVNKKLADHNKVIQKELTLISSELSFINNKKIGNIDKEREAIINYLDDYSHWLYGSLEVNILSFKYNNYEDINDVLKNIREAYSNCNQSWNKLRFWCTDIELETASHQLNQAILKYSHYHEATLGKLRFNLSWGKMYNDQFQSIVGQIRELKEWATFLAEEEKRIREENEKIVSEFWEGKTDLFKVVIEKNNIFQELAKKYLQHHKAT